MKKTLVTKKHYIAFLDILGGTEYIMNDSDCYHLNKVYSLLENWRQWADSGVHGKLNVLGFSDNILIAAECNERVTADAVVFFVARMAKYFLLDGYIFRGGVCTGNLYIDDRLAWGEGLVNAYNMEHKDAKMPRVIIDLDTMKALSPHAKEQMVLFDEDGLPYINYLQAFGDDERGILEKIEHIREWLIPEIQLKEDPSIIKKLEWLNKYLKMNEDITQERILRKSNN